MEKNTPMCMGVKCVWKKKFQQKFQKKSQKNLCKKFLKKSLKIFSVFFPLKMGILRQEEEKHILKGSSHCK